MIIKDTGPSDRMGMMESLTGWNKTQKSQPEQHHRFLSFLKKARLMLVDSWWLVDLWCLVHLLYDNSNFEMPRQKQLIANTDGGKTLGNDNEDHVLTCFQGLHLSNMLMNKILQWFRQYKIPWVGEFQTFPLYRVPNGRCFGWFWDVRDRSLQWHSECVLEDSGSLHSLYIYIYLYIHTCFTYCLYLNRKNTLDIKIEKKENSTS